MAKGINRLQGQLQQGILIGQVQAQGNALTLAAIQNTAQMAQTGMTTLAISANNGHTAIALSGAQNNSLLKFA